MKKCIGKALIAENGCSLVKINNAAYKLFKLALWELTRAATIAQNLFDVERLYLHKFRLFSQLWCSSELTNSLCRLVLNVGCLPFAHRTTL